MRLRPDQAGGAARAVSGVGTEPGLCRLRHRCRIPHPCLRGLRPREQGQGRGRGQVRQGQRPGRRGLRRLGSPGGPCTAVAGRGRQHPSARHHRRGAPGAFRARRAGPARALSHPGLPGAPGVRRDPQGGQDRAALVAGQQVLGTDGLPG